MISIKTNPSICTAALAALLCLSACGDGDGEQPAAGTPAVNGQWTTGDLHVHTFQSNDAQVSLEAVLDAAFDVNKLDWLALSNHLRVSDRDDAGVALDGGPVAFSTGMADHEVPRVKALQAAGKYAGKVIFSSFEWDVPTHDHMNVGIFTDAGQPLEPALTAINQFEYLFTNRAESLFKASDVAAWNAQDTRAFSTHADAVKAVSWLKARFPTTSYVLINHPSRNPGRYTAAQFRELNDTAPEIVVAVEGMLGNQMEPDRGGYTSDYVQANLPSRSYGGVDAVVAQVGGVWDALLGEGRRFWNVGNSDHHFKIASGQFSSGYLPGEYARNYTFVGGNDLKSVLAGIKSGKSFSVFGDLINALDFNLSANGVTQEMGSQLQVKAGDKVKVTIRFKSPERNNFENPVGSGVLVNARPVVDHVDLIAGDVVGKPLPGTSAYDKGTNDSTKVIASFNASNWKLDSEGFHSMTYEFTAVKNQYFRLRGTNLGMNVAGETQDGNPLPDEKITLTDNAARFNAINARNYSDLWFYSNPIFVSTAN